MTVSLPERLAHAFWAAQSAYTGMEARVPEVGDYQRRSRRAADLFAQAFDQTIRAASTADNAVASKNELEHGVRALLKVVQECEDPPAPIPDDDDTPVRLPEAVLTDARWAARIIRPIRRTTPLPTRTRMELRDTLFHWVVASEHARSGDDEQSLAHIAMSREHLVLAAEEALEYTVRLNLKKVRETFRLRNEIGRKIIGRQLPERDWPEDFRHALGELGEARRQKGRPETTKVFEEHAKAALDISIDLADAVDRGRIAPWRLVIDLLAAVVGIGGVAITIVAALT